MFVRLGVPATGATLSIVLQANTSARWGPAQTSATASQLSHWRLGSVPGGAHIPGPHLQGLLGSLVLGLFLIVTLKGPVKQIKEIIR